MCYSRRCPYEREDGECGQPSKQGTALSLCGIEEQDFDPFKEEADDAD